MEGDKGIALGKFRGVAGDDPKRTRCQSRGGRKRVFDAVTEGQSSKVDGGGRDVLELEELILVAVRRAVGQRVVMHFGEIEFSRDGRWRRGKHRVGEPTPEAHQRRVAPARQSGPARIVGARPDPRGGIDRDRAGVGENTSADRGSAAAGRAGIGAIKGVVDGCSRGAHRQGETRGDRAAILTEGHRRNPLGLEKVGALLEVVFEALHLGVLAGGVDRACERTCPLALGLVPPGKVASHRFGGSLRIQRVEQCVHGSGRKLSFPQFHPPVDVTLVKIRVGKQPGPPPMGKEIPPPDSRVRVASVRGGQSAIHVPHRPIDEFSLTILVEVGAEDERIHVKGPNIQKMMIHGRGNIDPSGISGRRVGVSRIVDDRVDRVEEVRQVLFLWVALRRLESDFFWVVIDETALTPGTESAVARIPPVHLENIAAGLAHRVIVVGVEVGDIHSILAPPDLFHDVIKAEIIAAVRAREIQLPARRFDKDLRHPGPHRQPADVVTELVKERIVQGGAVIVIRRMEDPVGFRGHAEQGDIPVGIVAPVPGFEVKVGFRIAQSGGAPAVHDRAAGQRRQAGKTGATIRRRGFPDPHERRLIAIVRKGPQTEI